MRWSLRFVSIRHGWLLIMSMSRLHNRWVRRYSELEYLEELIGCFFTRVICRIVAGNFFAFGVMVQVDECCLMRCWDEVRAGQWCKK